MESFYQAALTANGVSFATWDLRANPNLPQGYLLAHKQVFWFTGNSYPGSDPPYESELKAFLDAGGELFMSGQDLLDQAAGTTAFVHDYLHVTWDGTETQNDKATATVTGVAGNPVTNGIGTVPLDHSVLGANFEDEITPNGGALAAFTRRRSRDGNAGARRPDVRGDVQGRVPRVPVRGVRNRRSEGRPRREDADLLRPVGSGRS